MKSNLDNTPRCHHDFLMTSVINNLLKQHYRYTSQSKTMWQHDDLARHLAMIPFGESLAMTA